MKLKVDYRVPNNDCKCCSYFNSEQKFCMLFGQYLRYNIIKNNYTRCKDCKQTEKENVYIY